MHFMQWVRVMERQAPALRWLHHIPNGGGRSKREAGRLKAMGVRAGVNDYFLPAARHGYHGLYLEMKPDPELAGYRPSVRPEQREFAADVGDEGYKAVVVYGWRDAARAVIEYLELDQEV